MSKYIDADKLIHDLEERIFAYSEGYAEGDDNRKDAIETLLKDVKYQYSLQQEQPKKPVPNDLEEAAIKYADAIATDAIVHYFHKTSFIAGAKWQKEQMMKEAEKPCHTVEEWMEHIKNADELTKAIFSKGPYDVLYDALNRPYRDCYDAIKEFGELCYQTARQDMMQEAVCYIAQPDITATGNIVIPFIRIGYTALSRYGIKVGDKVKLYIVKED